MAIFLTAESRVLVQGITGGEGRKHGARMLAAGTQVVGGTNPKKAGHDPRAERDRRPGVRHRRGDDGRDRRRRLGDLRPAGGAKAAVIEAIDAEIPLAIVITEGIPVHDTAEFWAYACEKGNKTRIVGPNCPGLASPGKSNAGIIPADITPGGRSAWCPSRAR